MSKQHTTTYKLVQYWLLTGVIMVFFQIIIGGITRLTGSGLSITRWDIVMGTLPPLSATAWDTAFELYKATPQYEKLNAGMTLSAFKHIYFWEYFHRLWARLMLLVFIFPFFYFLWKRMLSKEIKQSLLYIVALAALEGAFGWIMVASGLKNRPWVNAYKLTIHFSLGLLIFSFLLRTYLISLPTSLRITNTQKLVTLNKAMLGFAFLQVILGALMSGMHAGLVFPTWPDMNGWVLPPELLHISNYTPQQFVAYDSSTFVPALVQFLHRGVAYLLFLLGVVHYIRGTKTDLNSRLKAGNTTMMLLLFTQVLLGIITLINCKGSIPVALGSLHQAVAVLFFGSLVYLHYYIKERPIQP